MLSSIAIDTDGERHIVNYREQSLAPVNEEWLFDALPRAVLVDTRWH